MTPTAESHSSRAVWASLLILAVVVVCLFHPSFHPHKVVFSNDGPLGAISSEAASGSNNFKGYWVNLNWVGYPLPSLSPSLSALFGWAVGALNFAKFYAPLAILFLGFAVWLCCRQLGFHPMVCLLAGLAGMLNSDPFSYACWGLPSLTLGMAFIFLALAALVGKPTRWRGLKLALAGFAVGLSIMESYDNGAIFSLYVAAFVVFQVAQQVKSGPAVVGRGLLQVGLVAVCAAFVAAQTLSTLVGTQVQGVEGMGQDEESKARRWQEATQWSLPKMETLRLVSAGLYGYRLDTPDGGNYWGGVGRDPIWDAYLDAPNPDPGRAPQALLRHSGAGFYGGVFVALVALWAVAQSFRRREGPFTPNERRFIWFWAVAALISLLLAWGRHAPFYQFFYALPYFSTIRNPIKFLHPFHLSLVLLFASGLHGLWRAYLAGANSTLVGTYASLSQHLKRWWGKVNAGDKRLVTVLAGLVAFAVLALLIYSSSSNELSRHLQRLGFPEANSAASIARFSIGEFGWSVLFLVLSAVLVVTVMSGALSGRRQRWALLAAGTLLLTDMVRANLPWILHYDYTTRYASNPIIDILKDQAHEHRVTSRLTPFGNMPLAGDRLFPVIYNEWLEHLFQYYNVQCLDLVQLPRTPAMDATMRDTFFPRNGTNLFLAARLWELSNTRYLLGMAGTAAALNNVADARQKRFRDHTRYQLVAKPGISQPTRAEDFTAVPDTNGTYSLIEFTGALPRAALYADWRVQTNDLMTLSQLTDPTFDPATTVLVAEETPPPSPTPTATAPGAVTFEYYSPKRIVLRAEAATPAVLLLNDRWHPDWKVTVDGQPAAQLRCNYIMRGVRLEPGNHTVEMTFAPPVRSLYVSALAIAVALGCLGFLVVNERRATAKHAPVAPEPLPPTETPGPGRKR